MPKKIKYLRLSLSLPKYRRCEHAQNVPDRIFLIHFDNDRGEVVELVLATRKTPSGLTNPFSNLVSRISAVRAYVVKCSIRTKLHVLRSGGLGDPISQQQQQQLVRLNRNDGANKLKVAKQTQGRADAPHYSFDLSRAVQQESRDMTSARISQRAIACIEANKQQGHKTFAAEVCHEHAVDLGQNLTNIRFHFGE